MSLSSDYQIARIKRYAELLKKRDDLSMKLSFLNDELINLSINMSNEDINEANAIYRKECETDEQ